MLASTVILVRFGILLYFKLTNFLAAKFQNLPSKIQSLAATFFNSPNSTSGHIDKVPEQLNIDFEHFK